MRHENLEHHRNRVEPFEVVGPAKFIASILGWDHDGFATALEAHLISGREVEVLVGDRRKPAVIIEWEVYGCTDQDATFKVKFHPVRSARTAPVIPTPDPWVKVGTTTLDGTIMQVATLLDVSGWGPPLTESEAENAIDLFMKQDERYHEPWLVGGRHLRGRASHVNASSGTALVRCDVVRRQSEIDAEMIATVAQACNEIAATLKPTCPECGPHGNRGEVLLASSWAKCTTCAGGKPGDLWGEVKAEDAAPAKRHVLAIGDLVFDEEVEVKRGHSASSFERSAKAFVDGHRPGEMSFTAAAMLGFKVPTLIEMHGAELDNLYRYYCGEPDGMSREEYRRIMLGEQAP